MDNKVTTFEIDQAVRRAFGIYEVKKGHRPIH